MIRIFIDNREADTDQHAAVSITLAVSSITKIETNRTGYCKTVRLPATARNRSLLGDADRIHAPELFNQQPHTARIEADGFTVIEGSPAWSDTRARPEAAPICCRSSDPASNG